LSFNLNSFKDYRWNNRWIVWGAFGGPHFVQNRHLIKFDLSFIHQPQKSFKFQTRHLNQKKAREVTKRRTTNQHQEYFYMKNELR
jgi:hypothetical protein